MRFRLSFWARHSSLSNITANEYARTRCPVVDKLRDTGNQRHAPVLPWQMVSGRLTRQFYGDGLFAFPDSL